MKALLKKYVDEFNANDDELYINEVPNASAYEWLSERIPLFECSDKQLEKTYYFRWWTYRKHIKKTPDGYAVTEFLPDVPWSGKYNVINAPAAHHFLEGRWLRGSKEIFVDYFRHYLNNPEDSHRYSASILNSAMQYEKICGSLGIDDSDLSKMIEYYLDWERTHGLGCGLFWSYDNYDAMEYSISGTRNGKEVKGIRPTLNSYMYAEAVAIAYFANNLGKSDVAAEFSEKGEKIKNLINENLLFDGFYKAKHGESDDEIEDIFLKMLKEYSSPDELSTELIKSHLSVLISLLFRGAKNRTASEAKHQCRFIETAINYIRENYAANITLDDVARKVSVSRIHLSRTFKSEIGIGLNEYINIYRLKQAQFLLAEFPTKPISEIAYDCGFNDSNYFASRFKKLLGVTPSQFRSHAAPSFIERQ